MWLVRVCVCVCVCVCCWFLCKISPFLAYSFLSCSCFLARRTLFLTMLRARRYVLVAFARAAFTFGALDGVPFFVITPWIFQDRKRHNPIFKSAGDLEALASIFFSAHSFVPVDRIGT
jgi:hypothetical protein